MHVSTALSRCSGPLDSARRASKNGEQPHTHLLSLQGELPHALLVLHRLLVVRRQLEGEFSHSFRVALGNLSPSRSETCGQEPVDSIFAADWPQKCSNEAERYSYKLGARIFSSMETSSPHSHLQQAPLAAVQNLGLHIAQTLCDLGAGAVHLIQTLLQRSKS